MVAQETNLLNAFETTLSTTLGASGTTVTLTAVTDSASNNITAPCYLVIEPDSATNREYVLVSAINIGTKTITLGDGGSSYRYLTGSSASSGLSHASGATIRYVPMAQHIEDINDRVDTIINSAGTAVVTTGVVKDEDNMASDSATHLATQQSIKKYVDDNVTAQDLDTAGNSGTGAVDLDSQSLTVSGDGTILTSTASGQGITFAIADATTSAKGAASFSSDNFAVSSGAVTIKSGGVDLTAEVTGTLPVANGGTGATTLTDGGVLLGSGTGAITATAVLTNGQLLIGDGTGDPTVGSLTGGSNVTITPGAGSITIAATDTTYSAGDLIDFDGTQIDVDLSEASEAAIADGDYVMFLDGGATGTAAKEAIGDIATLFSGDGLQASSSVMSLDLKSNGGLVIESNEAAVDLGASSITGTLDETDGGTGLTSYTTGDVVYASGSNTLGKLGIGSSGDVLSVSSGGIVEWTTPTTGDITGVTAGTNLSGGGTSGAVTVNLAIDSEVAFADQVASAVILKDYSETEQAVSSAAALAINLANGNTGTVTLAHNVTDIDFTNVPTDIATFTLVVTQDGTGSRTMAINAITVNADSHQTAKTAGGAGLTLSTAAAAIDILTFMFVDETPYLFSQLAFA